MNHFCDEFLKISRHFLPSVFTDNSAMPMGNNVNVASRNGIKIFISILFGCSRNRFYAMMNRVEKSEKKNKTIKS